MKQNINFYLFYQLANARMHPLKHYNDSRVFIEYSNDTDDIYENIKE